MPKRVLLGLLATVAAVAGGTAPAIAETIPGAPSAHCRSESDILSGLKLTAMGVTASNISKRVEWVSSGPVVSIIGRCASDVVAARATQLRLKSGATVDLMELPKTGVVPIRVHQGATVFDDVEVIGFVKQQGRGEHAGPLMMTEVASPAGGVKRYVGVWSRSNGSMVGFVDLANGTNKRTVTPLFDLPLRAEAVYYFPAIDAQAGQIAVLARDGKAMKILWFDVAA